MNCYNLFDKSESASVNIPLSGKVYYIKQQFILFLAIGQDETNPVFIGLTYFYVHEETELKWKPLQSTVYKE